MLESCFVSLLCCPACQSNVIEKDGCIVCINKECALNYPIVKGIPMMLVNEAVKK